MACELSCSGLFMPTKTHLLPPQCSLTAGASSAAELLMGSTLA